MRHIRKNVVCALLLGIVSAMMAGRSYSTETMPLAFENAAKLYEYQRPDGALMLYPTATGQGRLVPYFSNIAALAWTESARVTTDTAARGKMLDACGKWLDWYAFHMNADGAIYDFECDKQTCKPTGTYDSTDSYAATFCLLLLRHHDAAGNAAQVRKLEKAVRGAHKAIELTMDRDGLTYAHPFYPARYLMDNCEVAAGLASLKRLYAILGDSAGQARAAGQLDRLLAQIGRYYQRKAGVFGYTMSSFGTISGDFSKAYPDALANLMVLGWLSAGDAPAKALLGKLKSKFWDSENKNPAFPNWWIMAALACGDGDLKGKALEAAGRHCRKRDVNAPDLGMAAALCATGIEAFSFPELRLAWDKLTTAPPQAKSNVSATEAIPPGARVVLTGHKAKGGMLPNGQWKMEKVKFPLRVDYRLDGAESYLQINLVFPGIVSWDKLRAIKVDMPDGAVIVASQLQIALMEADGDVWDFKLPPAERTGKPVELDVSKLAINRWGRDGDGKCDLSQTAGLRFQIDGNGRLNGEFRIEAISAVPK
ncbi:MAG: hypothetical protein NTY46_01380 [Candidatus Sumerlaeota bacterium]|nr:hypothetical protein [Candidatus Sumerlaeota bacterium]